MALSWFILSDLYLAILYTCRFILYSFPLLARACSSCLSMFSDLQSEWLEKPNLYFCYTFILAGLYFHSHRFLRLELSYPC
ncbi:hypothetical protein [Pontibacter chinhatensis]|uniref:hypothetical protein n=1 Tax=Pontibacter chinhatensis TaxID=1436961 RepID=UPI001113AE99|nr:hypothetical protein [Pontibacter chinhatensis]